MARRSAGAVVPVIFVLCVRYCVRQETDRFLAKADSGGYGARQKPIEKARGFPGVASFCVLNLLRLPRGATPTGGPSEAAEGVLMRATCFCQAAGRMARERDGLESRRPSPAARPEFARPSGNSGRRARSITRGRGGSLKGRPSVQRAPVWVLRLPPQRHACTPALWGAMTNGPSRPSRTFSREKVADENRHGLFATIP